MQEIIGHSAILNDSNHTDERSSFADGAKAMLDGAPWEQIVEKFECLVRHQQQFVVRNHTNSNFNCHQLMLIRVYEHVMGNFTPVSDMLESPSE